ncbi:MAG: 16S rRNA (adenine(1518)-N(6)/adenine(1519)-N(6))-dimethyltransferase RsmA [Psychroflexus sp.]|nr:16S rRNA (adenine(1518)-N(6)/adenine(1519)-N(6))-dimethyltransferase RsmA [Psychroflexus sp.]MDN6309860.1 16S rRNA (adenine(1518)-N(6)/adenine(1519)-N(6))-dimethyltransferase RsmA [Psychroflexus sp.]
MQVKAKKHLGQHFLKDENIAQKIADTLSYSTYDTLIEIGPGMGVLTKYLLEKPVKLIAMDIDTESVDYLNTTFRAQFNKKEILNDFQVMTADFLKEDVLKIVEQKQFGVIGNYPYNISTQIVFKTIENRAFIPEFAGMFQKEVAKRICADPGSKVYGITSVLSQAFYKADYLFTVKPEVFNPPPKVESGVLRLVRREKFTLDCDEKLFFKVVKTAFGQRRKTIRNSLKSLNLPKELTTNELFSQRPEQLSVAEFITLTQKIDADAV